MNKTSLDKGFMTFHIRKYDPAGLFSFFVDHDLFSSRPPGHKYYSVNEECQQLTFTGTL